MRGFEQHLKEFQSRGIRVVAISVDPSDVTRRHSAKQGYTYTFLSDTKAEVIRRYDLLHSQAEPSGQEIARPAEFLIDTTGTVRWVNLTDDWRIRPRPEQVLTAMDGLNLASSSEP